MSFLNGLKRVEKFLTNVADAITPEDGSSVASAPYQIQGASRSVDARGAMFRDLPPCSTSPAESQKDGNGSSILTGRNDFSFIEMPTGGDFLRHYSDMLNILRGEIFATIIPTVSDQSRHALVTALRQEMNAMVLLRDGQKELERCLKKQEQEKKGGIVSTTSEEATSQAQANLEQFQAISTQTKEELLAIGANLLNSHILGHGELSNVHMDMGRGS